MQALSAARVSAPAQQARLTPLAKREALQGFLFIAPWMLGFLLFTAGPFLVGFFLGFADYDIIQPPRWVGLDNYVKIFTNDAKFGQSVYNTVYYVALSVPLHAVLALLLAVLLNQRTVGIPFFRTCFYIPSIVPVIPSVALFIWILHDRFGLLNSALYSLGIIGPGWLTSPEWSKPALILWSTWQLGGGMIIYLAGLQGVPQELYEAGSIDGCGVMGRFWHVTIPMISPTILFVLIMGVIGSFQVFTAAYILGSANYGTAMAGPLDSLLFWVLYIYHQGFYFYAMGYASALAWVLFVVILALTIAQFRLASRWVYYETESSGW